MIGVLIGLVAAVIIMFSVAQALNPQAQAALRLRQEENRRRREEQKEAKRAQKLEEILERRDRERTKKLQAQATQQPDTDGQSKTDRVFYYQLMGEIRGPFTAGELRAQAEVGYVTFDSFVRKGKEGNWVSASRIKGLFDEGQPPSSSAQSSRPG